MVACLSMGCVPLAQPSLSLPTWRGPAKRFFSGTLLLRLHGHIWTFTLPLQQILLLGPRPSQWPQSMPEKVSVHLQAEHHFRGKTNSGAERLDKAGILLSSTALIIKRRGDPERVAKSLHIHRELWPNSQLFYTNHELSIKTELLIKAHLK